MDFIFTEEFQDYYLVIFNVCGIDFSSIIDKETKRVVDIFTLKNGKYGSVPYNENTSLKTLTCLPVNYFEVEDALIGYFNNEGTR